MSEEHQLTPAAKAAVEAHVKGLIGLDADAQLTPDTKRAVDEHVRSLVGQWLRWVGIANVAALAGMILYVVFVLPDVAAERLVPGMNQRVANLTTELEDKLSEAFVLSGKVEASYTSLQKRTATLGKEISQIEAELEGAQKTNLAEVSKLVADLGAATDVPKLLDRINAIERIVAGLGKERDGPTFTITNPRIGGADAADCPPGTFVSQVHASKGVGGRYAVDGISELRVSCAPLQ